MTIDRSTSSAIVLSAEDTAAFEALRMPEGADIAVLDKDGNKIDLPERVQATVLAALRALTESGEVAITRMPEHLTSASAADVLGISRPTLMKGAKAGKINRWLQENKIRIWNEWADENDELGPVCGVQWRSWPTPDGQHIDQIQSALDLLTQDPESRRNVVSAWNVSELDKMALMPCHLLFQLYVADGKLSMQVYQRSADMILDDRSTSRPTCG